MTTASQVRSAAQLERLRLATQATRARAAAGAQARQAEGQTAAQARQAISETERQAQAARSEAQREAESRQAEIRKQRGQAEREAEAAKSSARETQRIEQRKVVLPTTRPRDLGLTSYISNVETARKQAHQAGESAKVAVIKQKADIDKDIQIALANANAEIAKQVAKLGVLAPYKSVDGYDLVRLFQDASKSSEIVLALGGPGAVDSDLPNLLMDLGFSEDSIKQAEDARYTLKQLAPYKLPDNTYDVAKAYEAIVAGKLSKLAFTTAFGEGKFKDVKVFYDSNVEIKPGQWVVKAEWTKLTPAQQNEVIATGQYTNDVKATAREQFDQWKDTDPSAPKDAIFEGESSEGGFQYSSPSAMSVEVETAKGKVTMPVAKWDSMPDIHRYETVLGRVPTASEWQGYRLLEAGINLAWWKELVPKAPDIVGKLAKFIPGEQVEERYVAIKQAAIDEWLVHYPDLKWAGVVSQTFEDLGFPAAKAIYPQVTIKDITGKEWAATGLSVALWAMPLWLPKVTSAGKVLFNIKFTTKTPIVKLQVPFEKVNLGLSGTELKFKFPVKLSWGAGLQRAGLSAKIESIAFKAGNAADELRLAMGKAGTSKGAVLSPKIASRLKIAQMNSLSADTKFIESLSGLKVTAKQIKLLEKATGYKGLVTPIRNVGIATKALDSAWATVSKTAKMYGMGSRNYIFSLRGVTKARLGLGKATDKLSAVLRTRYVEPPSPAKFAGYKMKWHEEFGGIVSERPVPKSMIPPKGGGEYGAGGTMSEAMYKQQYGKMVESWHKTQPYEVSRSPVATKLQANLFEVEQYRVATLNELQLTAKYVEQLANQVKATGYPIFSAERAFTGPLPVMVSQPLSVKQTTDVSHILGISVKQVNDLAEQGKLHEILAQQLTDLQIGIMELVVMTDVPTIVQAVPKVKGVTDVEVEVLSQIALKVATDARAQNMTAEQIKEAVNTAVRSEAKAATELQVKAITKAAIKTATRLKIEGRIRPKIVLTIPGLAAKGEDGRKYPDGTIVWKMGETKRGNEYKIIPPPYTMLKPISSRYPPKGMTKTKGTPQETLTFIGGKVPFGNVSFDLGVTDGFVDVKARKIEFTGGGQQTNVGTRIESTTKGVSLANNKILRGQLTKPRIERVSARPRRGRLASHGVYADQNSSRITRKRHRGWKRIY